RTSGIQPAPSGGVQTTPSDIFQRHVTTHGIGESSAEKSSGKSGGIRKTGMTNVSVDGLKYNIVEKGSGQSLLLLHGFTGSSENWRDLIAFMGNRFRIIAVDLPGHGLTDSPEDISRYRIDSVAHDVVRILQHLDASPAHWLGYSMG